MYHKYMIFRPVANKLKSKTYEFQCLKENILVVRHLNMVFRVTREGGGFPVRINLNLKHTNWIYEIKGVMFKTYTDKGRGAMI